LKRQRRQLEEQFQESKSDRNKLNEELVAIRKRLMMRETEMETIRREVSDKSNTNLSLKADKVALQRELDTLKSEMVITQSVTTVQESAP